MLILYQHSESLVNLACVWQYVLSTMGSAHPNLLGFDLTTTSGSLLSALLIRWWLSLNFFSCWQHRLKEPKGFSKVGPDRLNTDKYFILWVVQNVFVLFTLISGHPALFLIFETNWSEMNGFGDFFKTENVEKIIFPLELRELDQ